MLQLRLICIEWACHIRYDIVGTEKRYWWHSFTTLQLDAFVVLGWHALAKLHISHADSSLC